MTVPTATYRLQFRNGMTLERSAALVPYLAELGVSQLYASPLFAAAPGSTHGYDGIDFTRIDPALGGEAGFDRLATSLDEAGLGLLLDFVPNHMAAAESNPWWRSVLEWGAASPVAAFFDIDWSAPSLLLPILGAPYEEALGDGVFGLDFDAASGRFNFTCYDRRLPLTPPSYALLLTRIDDPEMAALADAFAAAGAGGADDCRRQLVALLDKDDRPAAVAAMIADANADREFLHAVHEAQIWRLVHWRRAREALTYRRFFEIADLVCLRVEDAAVFEAVHARLIDMIRNGAVDAVRIDHVDGLADPRRYLERLQQARAGGFPLYVLVEKILEHGETLRPDWPVAGTTGYEFITVLAGLFVDRRREDAMTRAYDDFIGERSDYARAATAAKRAIFAHNLAAELNFLTDRAEKLAAGRSTALTTASLRDAIVALAAALPVYRTYVDEGGPSDIDRKRIEAAVRDACTAGSGSHHAEAAAFVGRLLLGEHDPPAAVARAFITRFQQTTGPVMAKGIEDTMFYRYNRLIALSEVGGAPDRFGAPLSAFHDAMAGRLDWPGGLSATSTHDTKRGEDARARIYVLSEDPDRWQRAVARWSDMNAPHRLLLAQGLAPEPSQEWAFYQALLGAWPAELVAADPPVDWDAAVGCLRARMAAYMEKAVREAKLRTSWTDPDGAYERAVGNFVESVLSVETGQAFLEDFRRTCFPVWIAGAVNSLAQLAIKLAAPGVPDIYQGAELWDCSLVDPDNRRAVDFALRRRLMSSLPEMGPDTLLAAWQTGAPKLALTVAGLRVRAAMPSLFAEGSYVPLTATGPAARHIVAFARRTRSEAAMIVAPRFTLGLAGDLDRPLVPPTCWEDTAVVLPRALHGIEVRDAVAGDVHLLGARLGVAELLARFPVALLAGTG